MLRDLTICLLSSLNVLIFSFVLLNSQAFHKVEAFTDSKPLTMVTFDQVTGQIQQSLVKNQINRLKKSHHVVQTQDLASLPVTTATLSISKINVLSPIVFHESLSSEEAQQKLEHGAISLSPFIPPSQKGQTVIFGHSSDYPWRHNEYATLFTLLPRLIPGDIISITSDRNRFLYEVDRTQITDTDLTGLIEPSPESNELILSTCYPIGFFSKRFNVVAKPITRQSP